MKAAEEGVRYYRKLGNPAGWKEREKVAKKKRVIETEKSKAWGKTGARRG